MRIGIDLGGTKIEGIVIAPNGDELVRHRVLTPQGEYEGTLATIAKLVRFLEEQVDGQHCSVGIATPGAVSAASGMMKNCNSVCLNGKPLRQDLEKLLERPIHIANDADCFALSEATDGAAAGAHNVFGVIIGTGTGGGIVIDGKLLSGPNAIAGEWGHNPMPWPKWDERPGPPCYCGKRGCIETFLSGPALSRDHYDITRQRLSARDIALMAANHHHEAEETLARYEDRLARALAGVINILDPEVIVLGGGISKITTLYDRVPRLWQRYVFSDQVTTRLVPPVHGDSSGVRGAAWLWSED